MGIEIERKFQVNSDLFKKEAIKKTYYKQGYIYADKEKAIRVRICDNTAFLTIKGGGKQLSHAEYEYNIPYADACEILDNLCNGRWIEKFRYIVNFSGMTWEVDEFLGDNDGLVIAEIELTCEEQSFEKPEWVGTEVTGDPRYYNSNLITHPYNSF